MSHATGLVRFPNGTVMWYEYNGTSDVCIPTLWDTFEEMWAHWRSKDPYNKCTCSQSENVEIFSDYGSRFYWDGKACRNCKAITEGFYPYELDIDKDYIVGTPEWVVEARKIESRKESTHEDSEEK